VDFPGCLPHQGLRVYCIEEIPFARRSLFCELTFPLFRPLLTADDADARRVFVGVALFGQPIALAIGEVDQENKAQADIHSIFVAAPHRRRSLGSMLLTRLEEILLDRGAQLGRFTYMSGLPQTPSVEALLRKNGWLEPRHRMMICDGEFDLITQAPWMQRRSFHSDFSTFLWRELSPDERAGILDRQAREPWYPEELSPFRNQHLMEPTMSLGLRYRGEIVGWCIAHRISIDTVRFFSFFVRRDVQGIGRAVPLLANSIYLSVGTPIFKARFDVAMDNLAMLQFVRNRMAPYLTDIRYILRSHKRLQPSRSLEMRSA
jgi:GNAT superfamily N-acetyltransferase